jgi:hypothetical protein
MPAQDESQSAAPAVVCLNSAFDFGKVYPTGWCTLYLQVLMMPLSVGLVLTCAGLRTPVLVERSRRNVVASKILLGVLFLGMTAMLVLVR